jgi:hypothetical protein
LFADEFFGEELYGEDFSVKNCSGKELIWEELSDSNSFLTDLCQHVFFPNGGNFSDTNIQARQAQQRRGLL